MTFVSPANQTTRKLLNLIDFCPASALATLNLAKTHSRCAVLLFVGWLQTLGKLQVAQITNRGFLVAALAAVAVRCVMASKQSDEQIFDQIATKFTQLLYGPKEGDRSRILKALDDINSLDYRYVFVTNATVSYFSDT